MDITAFVLCLHSVNITMWLFETFSGVGLRKMFLVDMSLLRLKINPISGWTWLIYCRRSWCCFYCCITDCKRKHHLPLSSIWTWRVTLPTNVWCWTLTYKALTLFSELWRNGSVFYFFLLHYIKPRCDRLVMWQHQTVQQVFNSNESHYFSRISTGCWDWEPFVFVFFLFGKSSKPAGSTLKGGLITLQTTNWSERIIRIWSRLVACTLVVFENSLPFCSSLSSHSRTQNSFDILHYSCVCVALKMLSLQIHSASLWRSAMNPAYTEGFTGYRLAPKYGKSDFHISAIKHTLCNDSSNVVNKHL